MALELVYDPPVAQSCLDGVYISRLPRKPISSSKERYVGTCMECQDVQQCGCCADSMNPSPGIWMNSIRKILSKAPPHPKI